jgi:NADH-ubiquinone oxidoreductase chain 4
LCHAEASLGGSIILAGIILKLALYAILRILIPILPEASFYFTPLVFTICIITIIHASLSTIRQIDMKMLIANSSIAHMGIMIIGAFSNTLIGIEGSIVLGIAHGICSPLLFILLGGYLYERYHTRLIAYYRGLNQVMPLFSIVFFLATLANCGVPLTLNYLGEFMSLSGSIIKLPLLGSLATISIVLSAIYSFYLYNRLTGGILSPYLIVPADLTRREFYIALPLIVSLILLGIFPNLILEGLHANCSLILYTI